MSEVLKFPSNNESLIEQANTLSMEALALVTSRYGTGNPAEALTPEIVDLPYHNMEHTISVRRNSLRMAEALGLNKLDTAIVELAASAHDIVQKKERGVMEQESAEWLEEKMRNVGFSEDDINAASLAVLGTEPLVSQDGMIMGQKVDLIQFTSDRALEIAMCVACGDMAHLYQPNSALLSRDLYKEIKGVSSDAQPPMDGLLQFQKISLNLLRDYQFPHPMGERLFGSLRQESIEYQTWITQQLSLGMITSWDQLLQQDAAFNDTYRLN